MACACNVDLAASLKERASQFSQDDPRKMAAYAAARNIAEHPAPIHTAEDAAVIPRVGPVVLKMLRSFGIESTHSGVTRGCSPEAQSTLQKRRAQTTASEMPLLSFVSHFNRHLASDLRQMAPEHPSFLLNAIADAVQDRPEDARTLQLLMSVPHVRPRSARCIVKAVFKRNLTPAEKAFVEGIEDIVALRREAPKGHSEKQQNALIWKTFRTRVSVSKEPHTKHLFPSQWGWQRAWEGGSADPRLESWARRKC